MAKQFVKVSQDKRSYENFTNPVIQDGRIRFINSETGKNQLGYYELSVSYPQTDSSHHAELTSYEVVDNKVVGCFDIVENPPVYRTFSKLNLETTLFSMGLINSFDSFLQDTTLSNQYGEQPLRRFYDRAQELKEDNVYFSEYLEKAIEYMGIDRETADRILENSVLTSYAV